MNRIDATIEPAPTSRLPWSLIAATLVAMTGLYFTSGFSGTLVAAIALVLSQFATLRLPDSRAVPRAIRAVVFTLIISTIGLPETGIRGWYLRPEYTNLLGALLAAEMAIRAWEPQESNGTMLLLSALVMAAGANTYDQSLIPLLGPLYVVFLMVSLRRFAPMRHRQPGLLAMRVVAGVMVLVVGFTGIQVALRLDPQFQLWASDWLRRQNQAQEIGLAVAPMLTSMFNPEPTMDRVLVIEGPRQDRYLRAVAFDTLRSNQWSPNTVRGRDFTRVDTSDLRPREPGTSIRMRIIADTYDLLPAPLNTAGVTAIADIARDSFGSLRKSPVDEYIDLHIPDKERHQGLVCLPVQNAEQRNRLLTMPDRINPAVLELAQQVAGDGEPLTRATRIALHLRSNHEYSLTFKADGADPLSDFILNKKPAHCEYFASALVIMARAAGVPARFVTGYLAHEPAGENRTVVRGRDAHAWAECWIDGVGWITLDATPAAGLPNALFPPSSAWRQMWERIVDFPGVVRLWLSELSRRTILTVIFGCAGGVLVIQLVQWIRKRRVVRDRPYAQPHEELVRLGKLFEKWLTRSGTSCAMNCTWREHVRSLDRDSGTCLQFIQSYDEARFGGADGARLTRLRRLLENLETDSGSRHG